MDLNRPISEFFYKKGVIYRFLVWSVIFAFLFITLFRPFSMLDDRANGLHNIIYSAILSLSGAAIIAISRFLVRAYGRKHTVTYGQLLTWSVFIELMPLTAVYTVASSLMSDGRWQELVFRTFIYITLLLLLLYALFVFSLLLREKNKEVKELRVAANNRDNEMAEVHPKQQEVTLPFYNEKGELKVTIHKSNLLYIESADNYVYLWYINKENISKMLIRNTLKAIEAQLSKTNVIRCHRSYMINLDHVSMIRKDKGNLFAVFDINNVNDIPVSGSYYDRVLKIFISH